MQEKLSQSNAGASQQRASYEQEKAACARRLTELDQELHGAVDLLLEHKTELEGIVNAHHERITLAAQRSEALVAAHAIAPEEDESYA